MKGSDLGISISKKYVLQLGRPIYFKIILQFYSKKG